MRKHCFIAGSVVLCSLFAAAQTETKHYVGVNESADYTITNGVLNGKYVSHYKNGVKKAEGNFVYNRRIGKWDVYDSTGKLKIERNYSNPLAFTQTYPALPEGPAKLLSAPVYIPEKNTDGYYTYYFLEQREVMWSQRDWAYLYTSANPELSGLFKLLYTQIKNGNIDAYKCEKDIDMSFRNKIDFSATPLDTTNLQVVGYKIKEDWFYTGNENYLDCRIIGICPVVKNKQVSVNAGDIKQAKFIAANSQAASDTVDLFWLYYPQTRKYLAKEKITSPEGAPYIQNLDDVFFWRSFNERIVTQTAYKYNKINPVSDSWGTLIKMLEMEHDIWMGKASYN